MAGKLLYSRILQNRIAKNQASLDASNSGTTTTKPPQQYYSGQSYDDQAPMERRPADHSYSNDRYNNKPEGNKIRRGPGRRLAKEKRSGSGSSSGRNMDPALMQKYSNLPESLQEKVNATIEICYQQHMANRYKNSDQIEDSHYDQDIEIDADDALNASDPD